MRHLVVVGCCEEGVNNLPLTSAHAVCGWMGRSVGERGKGLPAALLCPPPFPPPPFIPSSHAILSLSPSLSSPYFLTQEETILLVYTGLAVFAERIFLQRLSTLKVQHNYISY